RISICGASRQCCYLRRRIAGRRESDRPGSEFCVSDGKVGGNHWHAPIVIRSGGATAALVAGDHGWQTFSGGLSGRIRVLYVLTRPRVSVSIFYPSCPRYQRPTIKNWRSLALLLLIFDRSNWPNLYK